MTLDPRIPLMAKGFDMPSPFEQYGQLAQLKNAAMHNRLAEFQLQQAQQQQAQEEALRQSVAQSGGDWGAVSKNLLAQGHYKPALEIESMQTKRATEAAQAKKAKADYDKVMADATRSVFSSMAANPTEEGLIAGANELVGREIMDADKVDAMLKTAHSMPMPARQQWLAAQSAHVEKILDSMFPKPTEFERLGAAGGLSPEQIRAGAARKFAKDQEHAPGASVTIGSPSWMVDASGNPVAVQMPNRPGELPQVTPFPNLKPQPSASASHLTEGEAKGTMFYSQMDSAEREISNIVGKGFDPASTRNQIGTRMAQSDWTNWLAPKKAQQYAQATEQWAEAYLRLKTGAATTKDEIKRNARAYFPQPGDAMDVIQQKNAMRKQAIGDVSIVAGRGMEKVKKEPDAAGWKIQEVK